MKLIHIDCLREWLNSKCTIKQNDSVKTYCWKALECELCKQRLPDRVPDPYFNSFSNEPRKYIDLLSYEKPEKECILLESVTQ
jgi:hypothetical protein